MPSRKTRSKRKRKSPKKSLFDFTFEGYRVQNYSLTVKRSGRNVHIMIFRQPTESCKNADLLVFDSFSLPFTMHKFQNGLSLENKTFTFYGSYDEREGYFVLLKGSYSTITEMRSVPKEVIDCFINIFVNPLAAQKYKINPLRY